MVTKQTKIFSSVSVLLFLTTVGGLLFAGQYIKEKGVDLEKQAESVASFQSQKKIFTELEKNVTATESDRAELESYVLTEDKTIDFLADIEKIAIDQGVELTTNSLKVTEGSGLFDTLVISYALEGERSRVEKMVLLFETLPYHAFLSELTFQLSEKSGVESIQGSVALTISLLQYDR